MIGEHLAALEAEADLVEGPVDLFRYWREVADREAWFGGRREDYRERRARREAAWR